MKSLTAENVHSSRSLDALPGFIFQLVVAFHGHADRRAKGDDVHVNDFCAPEVAS